MKSWTIDPNTGDPWPLDEVALKNLYAYTAGSQTAYPVFRLFTYGPETLISSLSTSASTSTASINLPTADAQQVTVGERIVIGMNPPPGSAQPFDAPLATGLGTTSGGHTSVTLSYKPSQNWASNTPVYQTINQLTPVTFLEPSPSGDNNDLSFAVDSASVDLDTSRDITRQLTISVREVTPQFGDNAGLAWSFDRYVHVIQAFRRNIDPVTEISVDNLVGTFRVAQADKSIEMDVTTWKLTLQSFESLLFQVSFINPYPIPPQKYSYRSVIETLLSMDSFRVSRGGTGATIRGTDCVGPNIPLARIHIDTRRASGANTQLPGPDDLIPYPEIFDLDTSIGAAVNKLLQAINYYPIHCRSDMEFYSQLMPQYAKRRVKPAYDYVVAPAGTVLPDSIPQGYATLTSTQVSQPTLLTNPGGIYTGVRTQPDPSMPASDYSLSAVQGFEAQAGKHMTVVSFNRQWGGPKGVFDIELLQAITRHGSVPAVTWKLQDDSNPTAAGQQPYTLSHVIAGDLDGYIISVARTCAQFGEMMLMRIFHEFNLGPNAPGVGNGIPCPWAIGETDVNGHVVTRKYSGSGLNNSYVDAWKHIHDIFVANGATNVYWVWCSFHWFTGTSNGSYDIDGGWNGHAWDVTRTNNDTYPGDAYVDFVGLDVYNQGDPSGSGTWHDWHALTDDPYSALTTKYPLKPLCVPECGCDPETYFTSPPTDGKSGWLSTSFGTDIFTQPKWVFASYFNWDRWKIGNTPTALAGYRNALATGSWLEYPSGVTTGSQAPGTTYRLPNATVADPQTLKSKANQDIPNIVRFISEPNAGTGAISAISDDVSSGATSLTTTGQPATVTVKDDTVSTQAQAQERADLELQYRAMQAYELEFIGAWMPMHEIHDLLGIFLLTQAGLQIGYNPNLPFEEVYWSGDLFADTMTHRAQQIVKIVKIGAQ